MQKVLEAINIINALFGAITFSIVAGFDYDDMKAADERYSAFYGYDTNDNVLVETWLAPLGGWVTAFYVFSLLMSTTLYVNLFITVGHNNDAESMECWWRIHRFAFLMAVVLTVSATFVICFFAYMIGYLFMDPNAVSKRNWLSIGSTVLAGMCCLAVHFIRASRITKEVKKKKTVESIDEALELVGPNFRVEYAHKFSGHDVSLDQLSELSKDELISITGSSIGHAHMMHKKFTTMICKQSHEEPLDFDLKNPIAGQFKD